MHKYFIFALIAACLFVSSGFISNAEAVQNRSALLSATPTPGASTRIKKIELDKDEVFTPCAPGTQSMRGAVCDDNSSVKVKISVINPQNAELSYHYTVSGGRIVGQGARVSWDLSGVRAGTYTISVCIGGGSEFCPETQTKTVRVKQCECGYVDACPAIGVLTPSDSAKPGETVTFTAKVTGLSDSDLTYDWTVSNGTIIAGQGTPKIRVETTPEMADTNITATVELGGAGLSQICETTASKTVSIKK